MKSRVQNIQVLFIDDEQTTANQIVQILAKENVIVQFHLIDDLEEFEKSLRMPWDVIVFGHAYDLDYVKVINILEFQNLSIPIIAMPDSLTPATNQNDSSPDLMSVFQLGVEDVIARHHLTHLAYAIKRESKHTEYIKQNKKLTQQFKEAENRAQLLVKNSKSAVAYIHDGVHIYTNETYNELFGYHSLEDLIGMPVVDLIAGSEANSFKEFLRAYGRSGQQSEFKFTGIKADGSHFDALLQLAPASFEGEECIQIIIQPQLENSAALAAQLAALERIDPLTGLNNRLAFEEHLSRALVELKQTNAEHAVLFINIGNIGHIHTVTGLAGSDAAILEIARLLKDAIKPDELYRFRESSFTAILKQQDVETATKKAEELCKQISGHLIMVGNRTVQATISIGLVPINKASPTETEVLDRAYQSAEKVKLQNQGTGNGVYVYSVAENASSSDSALKEYLENAIQTGQLQLMFQHIYDTTEQDLELFEVYLRLPLGDGNLMLPQDFLPIAQKYHLEGRLDRWVLLNAAKQLKAFMAQYPKARLIINLGADSIQDTTLPEAVSRLVSALNPSTHPLVLQFNEANLSTFMQIAKTQINAFKKAGVEVSITGFGSSLNTQKLLDYLKVDMVKLDKTYMTNLGDDASFNATQKLVSQIQKHNDIDIIAGYIEATQDIAKAWSLGARYLQGYYFQQPTTSITLNHEEQA